ncbi:MAG: molybdopterin-dependent oxidoreductase [Pirellulaceae bacterium]|jgi:DMSO/TMAO reductase YedYZ molybdopterin-dependent catalytic subunit|nr:molybdopterin-dependent oxidoreductase [Pirellulaceae bacterium]
MTSPLTTRRQALQTSVAGIAAVLASPRFVFPDQNEEEELVPFLNMPRTGPNRLDWETLTDWITPQDQVFSVQHNGTPEVKTEEFTLDIAGLVERPKTLTIDDIRGLPKRDQLMTLECSGNGAGKGFMNAIYNSKWTGTSLVSLLDECGIQEGAKEIVFIGADRKEETLRKGTQRELSVEVPFGRSMSIEDVRAKQPLLAYLRNDEPLELRNGAPLRLIVPGWYGIANVKWLTRIEVRDTRYMGRFMARDYVTVRGEKRGGEVVFVETSVNRMNLKSIVARVTRRDTSGGLVPARAFGAVWSDGTDLAKVEVKVDDGDWKQAKFDDRPRAQFCWTFFSIDLGKLKPGKHTVVSRAIDVNGREQPSAEDDEIALKKTFWEAYQQWPREIELEA